MPSVAASTLAPFLTSSPTASAWPFIAATSSGRPVPPMLLAASTLAPLSISSPTASARSFAAVRYSAVAPSLARAALTSAPRDSRNGLAQRGVAAEASLVQRVAAAGRQCLRQRRARRLRARRAADVAGLARGEQRLRRLGHFDVEEEGAG